MNGTTVPTTRDNTYESSEVHRKSSEELYDTSFNKDQKEVLANFSPSGGSALIVNATPPAGDPRLTTGIPHGSVLDRTYVELYDALKNGNPVYVCCTSEISGPLADYTCSTYLFNVIGVYQYESRYRVFVSATMVNSFGSPWDIGCPTVITFSADSPFDYPRAIIAGVPDAWHDAWD